MSTSDLNRKNLHEDEHDDINKAMKAKAKTDRDNAAMKMGDASMGDSTNEILDVVRQRLSNDNDTSSTTNTPITAKAKEAGECISNFNNSTMMRNKKLHQRNSTIKDDDGGGGSNAVLNDAVDHRLRILESLVIVDEETDEDDPVQRKLAAAAATTTSSATIERCSSRRRDEQRGSFDSDDVLLVGNSKNHLKKAPSCPAEETTTTTTTTLPLTQLQQCQSKQNPATTIATTKPPPPCIPGAHRVRGLNNLRSSFCNSFRYSMGSSGSDSHGDDSVHPDDIFKPTKRPSKDESVHTTVTALEEFQNEEEDDDLDALFNNLAVANPVDDDEYDCENLPHAQGVCHSEEEAKRKAVLRQRHWAVVVAVPLVFVAGVVLIVTLVLASRSRGRDQQDFAASSGSNDASNGSEVVVSLTPEAYVLSLLPDETLRVVDQVGSPQAQALEWLLQDLDYNPFIQDERILQRFALATLYFSTRGEHWLANDDWLSHTHHECDWYNQQDFKMKCTLWNFYHGNNLAHFFPQFAPEAAAARCNAKTGLYENLWLDANNLVGEIPEEVYLLLPTLKTISLVNNKLVGPLSSNVGHLSNLEGFFSFGMKQGGQIPSQIGLLTNLRGLGLLSNEHTGTIPKEYWSLTSLETSALGGNPGLHGTLPTDIGSLTNLKWFCVFRGKLTGTIPTQVGLLSNLEMFDMEGNHLVGPIPSQLGSLPKMAMMSLHKSAVTGTIPPQLGGMGSSVTLLNLGGNDLTGTIPSQLASLTNLEFLDISENQNLVPSIPTQIELLPNLETLNI